MRSWVSRNKLATLLLVILGFILFKSVIGSFVGMSLLGAPGFREKSGLALPESPSIGGLSGVGLARPDFYPPVDYAPVPDVKDRLVIQESNLSLLVTDIVAVKDRVIEFAQGSGGYMVTSHVVSPQEQPTATVVVRIPSSRLKEALEHFRSLSIKVVSENLSGQDVTDQYVDVEKRIAILDSTMARFEAILAEAREVSDIVNLNQQIINIQSQIDSLKGQQEALKQNAQLAKITVYLSTDEIALPYAPSETFRPGVIFKLAVRSLVGQLRQLATVSIWFGVYAVIWLPVGLLVIGVYKRMKKSS